MKNTAIGPENGRMEGAHLVQKMDSFIYIPGVLSVTGYLNAEEAPS